MTWFDYAFVGVLALSIAWGVWRGLVRELLSLAGWVIAFLCANLFAGPLSEQITTVMRPELRVLFAWLGIFAVVALIGSLAALLLGRVIKAAGLVSTDRWRGALFGLARGLLVELAATLAVGLTGFAASAVLRESIFGPPLVATVVQLKPWLPPTLAQRLRYH